MYCSRIVISIIQIHCRIVVYQLRKLPAYGVVEFVQGGNAKRPMVAYDTLVFDFAVSLTPSDEGSTEEPATA